MAKIVLNVTHVTDEATNTWSDVQIDVCSVDVYGSHGYVKDAMMKASKYHIIDLSLLRVEDDPSTASLTTATSRVRFSRVRQRSTGCVSTPAAPTMPSLLLFRDWMTRGCLTEST